MRRTLLWLCGMLAGCLTATGHASPPPPPRLVVMVVVDQMRQDYLDRFAPVWSGGLLRMRDQGVRFEQARHLHATTATGPGHATLATGCHPSNHGIVANSLFIAGKFQRASLDPSTRLIGAPGVGSSPRDLLVDGLADWLKQAHPTSQVIALSLKDRAATALGGRHPDACLFMDGKSGLFVTSSYYGDALPAFVDDYQRARPIDAEIGREWRPRLDEAQFDRIGATADAMPYEGRHGLARTDDATFPHTVQTPGDILYSIFGDDRLLSLAERAIGAAQLGRDGDPDLLAISLSAADYIGHAYGADSREIADYYAWLDERIEGLLSAAAAASAPGWTLFVLTADHGVNPIVEHLLGQGIEAGRIPLRLLKGAVDGALDAQFGAADWVLEVTADIYLDHGVIDERQLPATTVAEAAARAATRVTGIDAAWPRQALLARAKDIPAPILLSYNAARGGDVALQFRRHYHLDYLDASPYVKANHATQHDYDQRIPMVFFGSELRAQRLGDAFASVDLAPTIAGLLRLDVPAYVDGAARDLTPPAR